MSPRCFGDGGPLRPKRKKPISVQNGRCGMGRLRSAGRRSSSNHREEHRPRERCQTMLSTEENDKQMWPSVMTLGRDDPRGIGGADRAGAANRRFIPFERGEGSGTASASLSCSRACCSAGLRPPRRRQACVDVKRIPRVAFSAGSASVWAWICGSARPTLVPLGRLC